MTHGPDGGHCNCTWLVRGLDHRQKREFLILFQLSNPTGHILSVNITNFTPDQGIILYGQAVKQGLQSCLTPPCSSTYVQQNLDQFVQVDWTAGTSAAPFEVSPS